MKATRQLRDSTTGAVSALGSMVSENRRARGWTVAELADRLGVSIPTLRRIEAGETSVAIGLFFEAAVLCGVELFSLPPAELPGLAREARLRTAVLPRRVRSRPDIIDDNF